MLRFPKNAQLWLPGYLQSRLRRLRRSLPAHTPLDVLFCVADHYEPDWGQADAQTQLRRVDRWVRDYPRLADVFRDSDGRPPQHTFFSPQEAFRPEQMERLAALCHAGYGEVEVHLHHGHDTAANLRARLESFKDILTSRYGLLSRDPHGKVVYSFIHGNWALDNGRLDAQFCGVNDELTVLVETGCYADFTMPAAPDPAQSRIVNRIYYAVDDPQAPRSYDSGIAARVGRVPPAEALLMVQGPLMLQWDSRVRGVLPRLENGTLDDSPRHHPTVDRFRRWIDAGVSVDGRPEWVFVKVHTHGAKETNASVLLGDPMYRFHEALAKYFNDGTRFRLHYVTAREVYNIIKAAEDGRRGNPGQYRDYRVVRAFQKPVAVPRAEGAMR